MAFVTDPNLLADIKKGDNAAWNLFAKKYGALIWLRGSDYHLTPDEQEQLRLLDAKIAEVTKKHQRGHVSFGLYAQGGSGSQMSANGVLMSPTPSSRASSSLS